METFHDQQDGNEYRVTSILLAAVCTTEPHTTDTDTTNLLLVKAEWCVYNYNMNNRIKEKNA